MFKPKKHKDKDAKARYFILTKDYLYYLKSKKTMKIRGKMSVKYMRTEYSLLGDNSSSPEYNIRFIKNMKYCDFVVRGKECYK